MATKKRKGLSADEKRSTILKIYHDTKEPFNLKEIETLASKQGVVMQTVRFKEFKPNDYSFID